MRRLRLPHINKIQALSYALFALSGAILLASVMLTMNVKVIEDWTLRVPAAEIHAGDTVTLVSEYKKLRNVTGKAVRYIECQNENNVYIRYPLNEAVADRGAGDGGTGIVVKVPDEIPDVPTTCKFTIAITYDVYFWKKVSHTQSSNEFTLLPPRDVPQSVSSVDDQPSEQTNQGQAVGIASGQEEFSSSSSNPTPSNTSPQSITSQSSVQPDGSPTQGTRQLEPTPQPAPAEPTNILPLVEECYLGVNLLGGCL